MAYDYAVPTVIVRATMPQYSFTIRSCDHERKDEHRVVLRDVSAALDYACRMVRELTASGYNDPGLLVIVRNEMRQRVLSIPSLPACAQCPLSICTSSSHAAAPAAPKGR